MAKKGFIIYENWAVMIANLPDEDAGKLIKKICNYKTSGTLNADNPTIDAIFEMIRVALDEDEEKYNEICEKRKESGSKGGKKKAERCKQKVANDSKCVANDSNDVAKPTHTDTDTDTDTDKDIEKEKVKEKENSKTIPPKIEWVEAYCKERNNNIDPQRFMDYYESKGWKIKKDKMKDWQACVRTWENRDKEKQNPKQEIKKSQYDFKAMQKWAEDN